jgi:hypothetical protein
VAAILRYIVEYADLPIIDLAGVGTPEGRIALAAQIRDVISVHGFFYVINHGYTPEQVGKYLSIEIISRLTLLCHRWTDRKNI